MAIHIKYFNSTVKKVLDLDSNIELKELILKYKAKYQCKDYYETLDKFGFQIKMSFAVDLSCPDKYMPAINYREGNLLDEFARVEKLLDCGSAFKSLNQCYEYLAKEYIYKLVLKQNYLNGGKI